MLIRARRAGRLVFALYAQPVECAILCVCELGLLGERGRRVEVEGGDGVEREKPRDGWMDGWMEGGVV